MGIDLLMKDGLIIHTDGERQEDILEYSGQHEDDLIEVFENRGFNPPPHSPIGIRHTKAAGNHPKIIWTSNTEPDLNGYEIYRNISSCGEDCGTYNLIGTVEAGETSFIDDGVEFGRFGNYYAHYFVRAIDNANNQSMKSDVESVRINIQNKSLVDQSNSNLPNEYSLYQNYPNPFNPKTSIQYALAEKSYVTLTIYNTLGEEITEIVNANQSAGIYHYSWDGTDNNGIKMANGVYLYIIRIISEESDQIFSDKKKMILLK